jgi:uncharacterized protein YlzI (FlbEa/FlbD family)
MIQVTKLNPDDYINAISIAESKGYQIEHLGNDTVRITYHNGNSLVITY